MPSGHIKAGNYERPLSAHAWDRLAVAAFDPEPSQQTNPGVCYKLIRMGYAEYQERPSPFKSHKPGRTVSYLVATDYGRLALETQQAE
ncbi:MAG: hypothetical protein AAGI03_00560 [Pseudomonadota bacterium]